MSTLRNMTNFKIYIPESRPYGSRRALSECEEPGVRRDPGGVLECPVDAETHCGLLVGPWQYQCTAVGGRLGGYCTRYTTLPGTHLPHQPRVPTCTTARRPPVLPAGHRSTRSLRPTKEILGVREHRGHARAVSATGSHLTPWLSGPLPGACSGILRHISGISQVYLRYIPGIS